MSQNPYDTLGGTGTQYGGGGAGGDFIDPTPSRTSVLAITALVISIVGCLGCFIPGPGAVAAMIGGLSIFFIARSGGRLTGIGIGVTAVVLGLFQSVAWIAAATGVTQAFGQYNHQFIAPAGQMMTAIEKGDFQTARGWLTKEAGEQVSDEDFRVFSKKYHDSMGAFDRVPTNSWDTIMSFGNIGKSAKAGAKRGGRGPVIRPQGAVPQIPLPGYFANGTTFLVIGMDPPSHDKSDPNGSMTPKFLNLGVAALDGTEVWVLDPDKASKLIKWGPSDPTPPTTPTAPDGKDKTSDVPPAKTAGGNDTKP